MNRTPVTIERLLSLTTTRRFRLGHMFVNIQYGRH